MVKSRSTSRPRCRTPLPGSSRVLGRPEDIRSAHEIYQSGRSTRRVIYPLPNTKPSLTYSIVDILHPSVLVPTKLKTWYAAEVSQEPSLQLRTRAHFVDIMASLQWLSDEHERINLEGYPGVPKQELLHLLCRLYQMHHQARPYLAATLSFKDMRDVLCS